MEATIRHSLATLDDIAVASLAEVRAPRRRVWRMVAAPFIAVAVLAAAVVIGAGLAAWRDALGRGGVAASPVVVEAGQLPAPRYLDAAGYRFTVSVVADTRYGGGAAATSEFASSVDGVAVRCVWDRLGAELPYVDGAFGGIDRVNPTTRYTPAGSGAHSESIAGVPAPAGGTAGIVCGAVDMYGSHGARAVIELRADPRAPIGALTLQPWTGVVGDAAAVAHCATKAGTFTLLAAYTSTADEIATWIENAAYPGAPQIRNSAFRTSYAPSAPIYVCYFLGQYAPSIAPPGPGQTPTPPEYYDRARSFVDAAGNVVMPQSIGQGRTLPLARPGGRF